MNALPPWAKGPFELLVHAEGHLLSGDDFDRRIALISFDNAVEVTITTYVTLNPIQRSGRTYPRENIEKWLKNYHSRLDFLQEELDARALSWHVDRGHIVWCHACRNEQYHGGQKGTPELEVLNLIRRAALWIFSVLYEIIDIEQRLALEIEQRYPGPTKSDATYDEAIDRSYDAVIVGEQIYSVSEILFAVDEAAYYEVGTSLCEATGDDEEWSA
jgi:hypothetical protein